MSAREGIQSGLVTPRIAGIEVGGDGIAGSGQTGQQVTSADDLGGGRNCG
jgi:hypothetical protein